MADIVVTFPKEPKNKDRHIPRLEEYKVNKKGYSYFAFKIGQMPKEPCGGDKCYIGFDNKIQGHFEIKEIRAVDNEESKDFGEWDGSPGNFIFCDWNSFKEYPTPKPSYNKGWLGFWYWDDFLKRKV